MFTGRIERDWWLSSFSALTRNVRHGGLSTPDRDGEVTAPAEPGPDSPGELRFSLRRGAEAGNLLHDLLEEVGDNVLALGETMQQAAPWRWINNVAKDVYVKGDRQQLLRVFENIARNAFEAGATEVRLEANLVPGCWSITVADNGPGLPKLARENLFQPFKGSTQAGGTGLGLAIARELAVAHGGSLRLAATGVTGTRFIVELPKAAWRNEQRSLPA